MKDLNEIYKKSFFGRRYKLHWRAPIFCRAVVSEIDFKNVIDVGCADGDIAKEWLVSGFDSYGMEGSDGAKEFSVLPSDRQIWYDIRVPLGDKSELKFDLVVSLEVAEHIEPEYADVYVDNLIRLSRGSILLSAAPPGQGGHYHVNCQTPGYWEAKFEGHGYYRNKSVEDGIKYRIAPWKNAAGIKAFYHNLLYFQEEENL